MDSRLCGNDGRGRVTRRPSWIPAFAGMTVQRLVECGHPVMDSGLRRNDEPQRSHLHRRSRPNLAAGGRLAAEDAGDAGDDEEAADHGVEADRFVEDGPAQENGNDGDDVGDEGGADGADVLD